MDTWYYSPYPEPYASQHKLYICEYTLKYFRKKKTLMRHLAKLDLRHPPGGREVGEGLCNLDGMGGEEDISLGGRGGGVGKRSYLIHIISAYWIRQETRVVSAAFYLCCFKLGMLPPSFRRRDLPVTAPAARPAKLRGRSCHNASH